MQRTRHAAHYRKNSDAADRAQVRRSGLCAEITGADKLGIWIQLDGAPYFVAHEKTIWLRDPAVRRMLHISLPNGFHLRWDSLDADLDVDAL
jgi:hypothetical protein